MKPLTEDRRNGGSPCGLCGLAALLVFLAVPAPTARAVEALDLGPRPRVIMTPGRLEKLRALAADGDERYVRLREKGERNLHSNGGGHISPGYARSGWAKAATEYALLHLIEPDLSLSKSFAEEALVYMRALADDLESVGDAKGGLAAVKADRGYPIRNHAIALATAYDWLYNYEGFTAGEKARFFTRLNEWVDWYEGFKGDDGGYKVKGPAWENYFAGYFAAKVLTAVATYDENPKSRIRYLREVREKMREEVLPSLAEKLDGGYPPEGWAYRCGYDRTIDPLLTLENALGEEYGRTFWRGVALAAIHSTKPDRIHIYDGGDWGGDFAGYPLPLSLAARLSLLLGEAAEGAYARFYAVDFVERDPRNELDDFESLLYVDLRARRRDFTGSEPLSYFSPGAGMIFMRSSWERDAFWCSFQAGGPHLADHQNRDQGHITINCLGRDLLIDSGMWREQLPDGTSINNYASETVRHNTIMIDDLGAETGLSQGYYGERTTPAFEDGDAYVYARAEITGAYAFYPWRKESNSARKVEREVFYVRPTALVLIDTVETPRAEYPKSLLFHFPFNAKPTAGEAGVKIASGPASLAVYPMRPDGLSVGVFRQYGTREGDGERGVYTWGAKVSAPVGSKKTRFVTVVSACKTGAVGGTAEHPVIEPHSASGYFAVLKCFDRFVTVGRSDDPDRHMKMNMPLVSPVDLYVLGMKPGGRYKVQSTWDIVTSTVRIMPAADGSPVSQAGVLGVHMDLQFPKRITLPER